MKNVNTIIKSGLAKHGVCKFNIATASNSIFKFVENNLDSVEIVNISTSRCQVQFKDGVSSLD